MVSYRNVGTQSFSLGGVFALSELASIFAGPMNVHTTEARGRAEPRVALPPSFASQDKDRGAWARQSPRERPGAIGPRASDLSRSLVPSRARRVAWRPAAA
jgi:hypothetical protein